MDQHAVNCIIDTVRANPGQVTIAAIDPCAALHPSADCIQQLLSAGANAHAVDACGRTALMRAADTPDGHVDFVLFIGMTDAELRSLADGRHDVRKLYGKYGSDLTDYRRNSLC